MRTGSLVTILALLCGCSIRHGEELPAGTPTAFDLGGIVVDEQHTVSHKFKFINTLDKNLKIVDVIKNCGCYSATVRERTIAPNQSTEITLSTNVVDTYVPRRSISCIVRTDNPELDNITYTMSLETFPRIQFRPLQLTMAALRPGRSPCDDGRCNAEAWLEVFRRSDEAADSPIGYHVPGELEVDTSGQPVEDTPARGVIRTRYPLHVRMRQEGLKAGIEGDRQVTIAVNTAHGKQVTLPVTWTWRRAIEVSPKRIHFGSIHGDTKFERYLIVRSTVGREFRVLSVLGDNLAEAISANSGDEVSDRHPSTSHNIKITLKLHVDHGHAASGSLTVLTDDSECPKVSVPWSAFVDQPLDSSARR